MRTGLARARGERFDLAIIGGGIIGLGAARDAALRGLRVALFEQRDFGWGTTARSTRLVHGGLRYLELLDFALVREDLREREVLLRLAPHLVRPLPFVVPIYRRGAAYRAKLRLGMLLYDALSFDKSLPTHRMLGRDETLAREPALNPAGLEGAALYYDAQVQAVERLGLENAVDADARGAELFTHTRVVDLLVEDSAVRGVLVEDCLTGETAQVRAALTLNAAGPWIDAVARLARPARRLLRRTKGVHLVTPPVTESAIVLFASDGRLFFVVPWLGFSYVGTTDTDWEGNLETVHADADDVAYLLNAVRPALPGARFEPIYYTTAGVRALVRAEGVSESAVSRKHAIWDHEAREGVRGLITILGGKLTAYRAIAEDAVDAVCRRLGRSAPCLTACVELPGGGVGDLAAFRSRMAAEGARHGLTRAQTDHLVDLYGRRAVEVLDLIEPNPDADPAARIIANAPDIRAQVLHAIEREAARTVGDVLRQRTMLGWSADQGEAAAPVVAELMACRLGWTGARVADELRRYRDEISLGRRWLGECGEPAATPPAASPAIAD